MARRDVFEYLLDHPEFATHVTRALKLARYESGPRPAGSASTTGGARSGTFELVHAAEGMRLMQARGVYQQRILPDIHGQAVVVIDYGTQPAPNGRSQINATVSGFVKLDSRILALASKLATSVATAKGEKEARRLVQLFAKTSRAIDADPAGVLEKVRQRPDVPAPRARGVQPPARPPRRRPDAAPSLAPLRADRSRARRARASPSRNRGRSGPSRTASA